MEFCNGDRSYQTAVGLNPNMDQTDQLSCSSCNQLRLALKEKFESTGPNEMIDAFLDTCYSLDSLADTCFNLVTYYFDNIYELTKQYLQSNDICRDINICPNSVIEPEAVLFPAVRNNLNICTKCMEMVRQAREAILKNSTEAQFKEKLINFCMKFHGEKHQCTIAADQYYHILFNMLKNGGDDESICKKLLFCSKPHETEDKIRLEIKVLDTNRGERLQLSTDFVNKESVNCHICNKVIVSLREMLKKNNDIKMALKHVCQVLKTENLENECQNMLSQHSDLIKDLVKAKMDHQQICRTLNMCLLYESQNCKCFYSSPLD